MKLTEAQEKWLAALESGEYKQGKGKLRDMDNCFCCLGVACELFIPDTMHVIRRQYNGTQIYYGIGKHSMYGVAPPSVVDILGLRSPTGNINDCGAVSLAVMNDNGNTFAEIAAFIRANPEKVFKQEGEEEE